MNDPMTPYDLIVATGLDAGEFATRSWAPPHDDLPGLVTGLYRGDAATVIHAWPVIVRDEIVAWRATAEVSKHPPLSFGALTPEEAERLRATTLTPAGADDPVGQAAVIGRSDPKPYTPPLPPIDTAESVQADAEPSSALHAEPADCGGPGCVKLVGPDGTIVQHDPATCPEGLD